jgi:nitrite reductase (NADH) small subunit
VTVHVGPFDELQPGEMRRVDAAGTSVVVVRVGDHVYACSAACAHRGGPLAEGRLNGARLVCPWHGWMFDVRTGACLIPARGAAVTTYPVRIDAGDVVVDVPASEATTTAAPAAPTTRSAPAPCASTAGAPAGGSTGPQPADSVDVGTLGAPEARSAPGGAPAHPAPPWRSSATRLVHGI